MPAVQARPRWARLPWAPSRSSTGYPPAGRMCLLQPVAHSSTMARVLAHRLVPLVSGWKPDLLDPAVDDDGQRILVVAPAQPLRFLLGELETVVLVHSHSLVSANQRAVHNQIRRQVRSWENGPFGRGRRRSVQAGSRLQDKRTQTDVAPRDLEPLAFPARTSRPSILEARGRVVSRLAPLAGLEALPSAAHLHASANRIPASSETPAIARWRRGLAESPEDATPRRSSSQAEVDSGHRWEALGAARVAAPSAMRPGRGGIGIPTAGWRAPYMSAARSTSASGMRARRGRGKLAHKRGFRLQGEGVAHPCRCLRLR
jgi:hypothetical protein